MATALPIPAVRERPLASIGGLLTAAEPAIEVLHQPRRLFYHLMVLEPTPLLATEFVRAFRAAGYGTHSARTWVQMLEWIEQEEVDAVLLDLDAIDASVSSRNISATRLITLMRRAMDSHPVTVAAVSRREYSEIEDTIKAGVDVFVNRSSSILCLIQRLDAARVRLAHQQKAG
jgi:DNA-binding response OmpR family regulator